ncbi:MAG: DNA primase, partial [Rhodocyclaceae bacterium]
MATNYDSVVRQLTDAGLIFDRLMIGPTASGRPWRCKVEGDHEKRGWYLVDEITLKSGDVVLVGHYGIWRGDNSGATKIELERQALTAEEKAAIRARLAADKKKA